MSMVRKESAGKVAGGLTYVLSDDTLDRYGDIIDPMGWDLRWFKKNPIALFGHNSGFPIGNWRNVRVEGGKLLAELVPAKRGTSARVDEIISLIEQDVLRATSVGFRPLVPPVPVDKEKPYGGQRYTKCELLETSIVSVPANPAALQLAKSLNTSDETISIVFGEHAQTRQWNPAEPGRQASLITPDPGPNPKERAMTTLSQRIVEAQAALAVNKSKLDALQAAETRDLDAIESVMDTIDFQERDLALLARSEGKIAKTLETPHIARRPLGVSTKAVGGFDLLVRSAVVHGIAHFSGKSFDQVLDERYPGHEETALITKADQTIGLTTGSHWADDLVQTVNQGFLEALTGYSIYPALRARGMGLNFDGVGTIKLPRRTAGTAGGAFVAEGSPIRVGKLTTAAAQLTPCKMGVIVAFSRELTKRSTPAIESLVRRAILEDTGATLDAALLDATVGSATRPAGLLYGLSAAASGYGGADHLAVKEDFRALLAPFIAANAADGITVVMNPAQGLSISLMDGPTNNANWFGGIATRVNIVESTYATAGRLIALRNTDFVTAMGDAPEFDVSEQATIHMEDTTPLEIVSASPTTADPVRSLWQTASTGVRMLMDLSWVMGRTGMVQWIDGTTY